MIWTRCSSSRWRASATGETVCVVMDVPIPNLKYEISDLRSLSDRVELGLRPDVEHAVCDDRRRVDRVAEVDRLADELLLLGRGQDRQVAVLVADVDLPVRH